MSEKQRRRFPVFTVLFVLIVAAAVVDMFVLRDRDEPKTEKASDPLPEPKAGSRAILPQRDFNAIDDAAGDGWATEALADQAGRQLKRLGKVLRSDTIDGTAVGSLVDQSFRCSPLVPRETTTAFRDAVVVVERGSTTGDQVHAGAAGFAAALRELVAPLGDAADRHVKFKTYRIDVIDEETFTTRQYVSIWGRTAKGIVEHNATWDIEWKRGRPVHRIASVRVTDYELTRTRGNDPLFADCTEAVLGADPTYARQILQGYHQFGHRYQDVRYFALLANPGIAVGDVNGDGLEDLYLCGEFGLPNRLYVQQPDGTVRDTSADAGVDWLENSRSALLVDLDNDGDQDLAVAVVGGVVVCANDGRGRFERKAVVPTADDTMSLSAADFDGDGRLDLYVCAYYQTGIRIRSIPAAGDDFIVHDANNGAPNSLLRNEGGWKFRDVTESVGLDAKNSRFSFAAAWDDFDNDGDLDCYVANDYGRDNYYRNEGGTFVDVSDQVRAEDSAGGMSITCGDYDRDGRMDVFVSNMFSAAGNRVTYQDAFKPKAKGDTKRRLQRLARGNTLLRNGPDGRFEHVSAPAGVEMGRWAWGSHFVDLNNDGWEDLLISNGYVTGDEGTGDL